MYRTSEMVFGRFDFGLTEKQEARAAQLHQRATIVDMVHQGAGNDALFRRPEFADARNALLAPFEHPLDFMSAALRASFEVDGGRALQSLWDASGVTAGMVYIDIGGPDAAGPGARYGSAGQALLEAAAWQRLALSSNDIRRAKADGGHALIGYCQPVISISKDLKFLDHAFANGLRVLMLTYNAPDAVGCGCTAGDDSGLTPFGRDVIAWCNDHHVLVDTSHCGPQTTLDACRVSRQPVLANHTAAAAIFPHPRGKSDDLLRAIADTGGVIGIVAVPFFLSADQNADMTAMMRHIGHVAERVGAAHVGIGTDWPLTGPVEGIGRSFGSVGLSRIGFNRNAHRIDATRNLIGFDDYRDFPNITRGLVSLGFDDGQVIGILGDNFLRVFSRDGES